LKPGFFSKYATFSYEMDPLAICFCQVVTCLVSPWYFRKISISGPGGIKFPDSFATVNQRTRNKNITSKAVHYRPDIVTRTPITRVELITISTVTKRSIWHNSAADFCTFSKIAASNLRILLRHLPTELRNI